MQPNRRILLEWSLVSLIVCSLVAACSLQGWLWRADLQLYDVALSRQTGQADPEVVIIAIDDDSLEQLGRWPWPRRLHAALLDRLREAGSGPVALDLIFAEASHDDPMLAAAIRNHGRVILPVLQQVRHGQVVGAAEPTPMLREAAAGLGHIQAEFDPDGIVRSTYLYEGWESASTPQLSLALLQLMPDSKPVSVFRQEGQGWQRTGWLRIPFVGPAGSFTQYAYADVLAGRVPDAALRGKIILVGATSVGMADSVPVPESGVAGPMPGVEVNANILTALRDGNAIRLLPRWLGALLSVAICFLQMLLLVRMNARFGLIWTGVVLLGILLLCALALAGPDLWIRPSSAIMGCLAAYPLWSWRRLEATQRYVRDEMHALNAAHILPPVSGQLDSLQNQLTMLRSATDFAREAQRFVDAVIAHLPVGVVALYGDGRVRVHNEAALQMLAQRDASHLAGALRALPWPDGLVRHNGLPAAPTEGMEIELDAGERPLLVSLAALGNGGIVIGMADLTRIKAAQQAREDTLRFVTHDLRAPLASVISLIDAPPPGVELTPRIRSIASNALGLIDDLFRLSRAEVVNPADFKVCDLVPVILDAIEICWGQAHSAQVTITENTASFEEALTRGNADLLHRALANLLSNAIKYGGNARSVEVTLSQRAGDWRIAVRDHGPGIPPEERGGLFKRFSRLPGAIKRGLPGSGLGLLMVATVAERHGGRIETEFPADGGSCFILILPCVTD